MSAFEDREKLVLTRNGIWMSNGEEIDHLATAKAFSKSIVRKADGYYLQIGRESKKIQVEDTAYFVRRIDWDKERILLKLSDETEEFLEPSTLKYRPGRLSCLIKRGIEEAKFLPAPYFDILKDIEQDSQGYFIQIEGKKVHLTG